MTSWLRGVISNAEQTAPRGVSNADMVVAKLQRVDNARQRLVMAQAELERAMMEDEEARFDLARAMKDYGLRATVNGKEPPPEREDDDA